TYLPKSNLFNKQKAPDPWEKFFTTKDENMFRARRGCPLVRVGNGRWAFMHATLLEYFVTRMIYIKMEEDTDAVAPVVPQINRNTRP
ncbi:hypothetical protein ABTL97_19655, partial [Acinetobacter baumannii]